MSGIGSLSWLNKYIGIPYKFGGRDSDGVDCYGLVKMIYKDKYGVELMDWAFDTLNYKDINSKITSQLISGDFEYLDEPEEACFAVCSRSRASHHIGLYFGGGIIHCSDGLGTIYQVRSDFERNFVNVIYGNWTP